MSKKVIVNRVTNIFTLLPLSHCFAVTAPLTSGANELSSRFIFCLTLTREVDFAKQKTEGEIYASTHFMR